MATLRRALSILCLLGGLAALAGAAPTAEGQEDQKPLADLDPLDPASCDHEDGFVVVTIAWANAWYEADQAGLLGEPRATDLAVWFVAMKNYVIESNDVKGACLALIESRMAHRF